MHELAELEREYKERAQPLLNKLVELRCMKPAEPIIIFDPINKCKHEKAKPLNKFRAGFIVYKCGECGEELERLPNGEQAA